MANFIRVFSPPKRIQNDTYTPFAMDEFVDIWDKEGITTGKTLLKSEAHRLGLFHPTVHVWFYTAQGDILFQQRGRQKKTFPMRWDISVAGHVGAGEPIIEAALREVKEEIGLTISKNDLQQIGVFKSIHKHSENFVDAEFNHSFLSELKKPFEVLQKEDSEVEALKMVSLEQFKKAFENGPTEEFVPLSSDYHRRVVEEIEKRL